ncbi:Nudix family hydrolase [Methylobacter sp. YRD-M1]|uniref:Nudix family hydrolase n=1 Tax=Methylobacter sp. YRD-M1 TaxID=2911520 RepID=UPI00227D2EE7|nr:Nudix family hydrolase [Methylobacter sp. YRD-M1]WAK02827.1 Nudix family hydrolase [Methylobacter sp. YRD-M1]
MKPLQVAVGVVKNAAGQILISLRDRSLHQGGLWEFPGGKIEPFETAGQALSRELKEELDITVEVASPLITIEHQYPDLAVQLHVFLVEQFSGHARGCEGQLFKWAAPDELDQYEFPAANGPIVTAARLPAYYAILDDADESLLLVNLQKILDRGVRLIQARLKAASRQAVEKFIEQAYPLCQERGALLLVNSAVEAACELDVNGIHLTSRHLMALGQRPVNIKWLAASCHNLQELRHAQAIGVDFAVLAPVLPTKTHPGKQVLGWQQFAELVSKVNLPTYALGGMSLSCLTTARQAGGQGIAAIRAFLD